MASFLDGDLRAKMALTIKFPSSRGYAKMAPPGAFDEDCPSLAIPAPLPLDTRFSEQYNILVD